MTPWVCQACREPQVCAWGAEPPAGGICPGCTDRTRDLGQRIEAAGLPGRYRSKTRADWERHFRRPWPKDLAWPALPEMLYIYGPTGTGKTTAAAVLLGEHLRQGGRGFWAEKLTIETVIREARSTDGGDLLRRLLRVELLVWDEPLAGFLTPLAADWILTVINGRVGDARPTIVTSQLEPAQLLPRDGAPPVVPALASRFLSGALCELNGEDARLRGDEP